jgi:hypothetical protein
VKTYYSSYLKRYGYLLGVGCLLAMLLFYRMPYYIYIPIPYISPDTFDYYGLIYPELVNQLFGPCFLPGVYSQVLLLYDILFSNPEQLVLIQQLYTLFVFLIAAILIYKLLHNYALLPLAGLTIYLADPATAALDIALIPDSMFRNTTILLSLVIMYAVKRPGWKPYLLLSTMVVLLAMFRTNGIYLYFLIILFGVFAFRQKTVHRYTRHMLLPFILLNLLWSAYNYKTCGLFIPSDPQVYTHVSENFNEHKQEKRSEWKLGRWFIGNITDYKFRSFYYTILPDTYDRYIQYLSDPNETMYNSTLVIPDTLKKKVLKNMLNFTTENNPYNNRIKIVKNAHQPKKYWIHLAGFFEVWHSVLFKNWLVFSLFLLGTVLSVYYFFSNPNQHTWAYIYLAISGIYLVSLFSLSIVAWHITRYIQVAEFAVYLCIPLIVVMWAEHGRKIPK